MDILKKIRKRVDIRMFYFLLGYRSRKRRKFISDMLMIKISCNNDEKSLYHNFLKQVFEQIFKRVKANNMEPIYVKVIKKIRMNNIIFKKFLLQLRLFYFAAFKKESHLQNPFKKNIENFVIELQECKTKRCCLYRKSRGKAISSLVVFNPFVLPEKVELISFSIKIKNAKIIGNLNSIEFNVWNQLKSLIESGKKVILGVLSRFHKIKIETILIGDEVLQFDLIVFKLFQGMQYREINKIIGKYFEKLLMS
jgi:hypothetical protein